MSVIRYLPLALLVAYIGKLLILGSQWSDSMIILVLSGLVVFWEANLQLKKLKDFEKQLSSLKDEISELNDIKSYVNSVRLSQRSR